MPSEDNNSRANLATLGSAREMVYRFLSNAFAAPPSTHNLATLRDDAFLRDASALFTEETLEPLRKFAATKTKGDTDVQEIRREFMSLFKVPGAQYVRPYESVYRDTGDSAADQPLGKRKPEGLLMGRSSVDVQGWYRLAAADIAEEHKDLPDHICLELNFLAHLCAKEQEFAKAKNAANLARAWQMQRDFLRGHVVSWVHRLRDEIHEKTNHPFFRAIADILVEFAQRDLATLETVLGPSTGSSVPDYAEASTAPPGPPRRRVKLED